MFVTLQGFGVERARIPAMNPETLFLSHYSVDKGGRENTVEVPNNNRGTSGDWHERKGRKRGSCVLNKEFYTHCNAITMLSHSDNKKR